MKTLKQISRDVCGLQGSGGFKAFSARFTAISAEGAGAANAIDVTVQITDIRGRPLKFKIPFIALAGVDTAGVYTGGTALASAMSVASGTAQNLFIMTSLRGGLFLSDTSGIAVIRLTAGAGVSARRLVIVSPGGSVVAQSDSLAWT